jgi:hypothetical protein
MIVAEDVLQHEKVVGAVSRNCVVGEVHILESSPKNVNEIQPNTERWTAHKARMSKIRNIYTILVRHSGGNKALGKPTVGVYWRIILR